MRCAVEKRSGNGEHGGNQRSQPIGFGRAGRLRRSWTPNRIGRTVVDGGPGYGAIRTPGVQLGFRPVALQCKGSPEMAEDRVYIFDTTMRDGEQSPGATMNAEEKFEIAKQLERLGVDIIEA